MASIISGDATTENALEFVFLGEQTGYANTYSNAKPGDVTGFLVSEDDAAADTLTQVTVAGPRRAVIGAEALNYDAQQPDFFEDFHVIPRSFAFGNILSTQTSPIEVFSGYRNTTQTWSAFINNAGSGTEITDIPSLPATLAPLDGYQMTLEVTTTGVPVVDDDLAFVFNFGSTTINVPITLNRIVLFPVRPEVPYQERIQSLTDVINNLDGSEQRIQLRKNPRSIFDWRVRTEDGVFDRQRMGVLLYDWQARTWGLPMWHEATKLSSAAATDDLTINVESTDYADYRVGGLALIYTAGDVFDVQTIASFDSTSITFENAILNDYAANTAVLPLRTANIEGEPTSGIFPTGVQDIQVSFRVLDNDSNIGDTSAFSTHNGLPLLDECNVLRSGTLTSRSVRRVFLQDAGTGITALDSPWDQSKHGFPLTLRASGAQDVWEHRQLVHALNGQVETFYVPTYLQDLTATEDIVLSTNTLVISDIGYTQHVYQRPNRKYIWLRTNDGTVYIREITDSSSGSDNTETLTVGTAWDASISTDEIDRISFLEEVRFASDIVTVSYERGARQVYFSGPCITVFDNS